MKRRDFLVGASASGLVIPRIIRAAPPCPPPQVSVPGGPSVTTACVPVDPLSDWQARISGPGVVWWNHFDSDAEMNQYRWASGVGNDPNASSSDAGYMTRSTSGGPDGGPYLQILRKSATQDSNVNWWRPFSPFYGPGNGKSANDPAAGGAVTLQTWSPTQGGSQTNSWTDDYYGPGGYNGQTFYLQMRVMSDPRAFQFGDSVGKKLYVTVTKQSDVNQELVTYAGTPFHRLYVGYGYAGGWVQYCPLEGADDAKRPGQQVGSQLANYSAGTYCDVNAMPQHCWQWGTNQWDTIMYAITPGTASGTGVAVDSVIQVYAANAGQ